LRTKVICTVLGLGLFAGLFVANVQAQRVSPHEKTTATFGGKTVTIEYGRPYVKGRNVWAEPLAPYGKVWRTGADEATKLTTTADLMIGPVHVPAGSYSLFTIPGEKEWTLIINKTAVQDGASNYDQKMDFARTTMTVKKLTKPVEQLTITLPANAEGGALKIAWSDVEASVPVTVH